MAQHKIVGQSLDAQIARLLADPNSQCYKVLKDGASKESQMDNASNVLPKDDKSSK